jgi:choline-sulfatase
MHKKTIVIILCLILALGVVFNSCKSSKKKDYNVVLIVIDTLRSDHLPFYGYEKNTAPFLLGLSKESVVFENAFAASSWTSPATASIFTSLYPYQHGVLMGLLAIRNAQKIDPNVTINRIPEEITTITEVLKKEGYQTYGVADNLNIDSRQGFTQGFDKFRTFMYRGAEKVNEVAKSWHKKITKKGKYFLYLHYMDPHAPYHGREPWYEKHEDRKLNRISSYDSEINYADKHIQEMFKLYGWDKNTLVIVTSDHGEGLWDHGLMGHGKTLYREEIQVPLMVYLPKNRQGKRIPINVTTLDILPTVRALLGLEASEIDEGANLVPLMEGKETELGKRDIFSHLYLKTNDVVEWKSTVYKKWHSVVKLPSIHYLFSLLKDKKEQNNVYEVGKKIAIELEKRFDQFRQGSLKFKQQSSTIKLDKKKTDKLKSLGYVN